ncbi:D-2-hydroxyglutarate dehydrogenase [invertebrate metagenome]|uniref:D-2-hydroxyglutarate dehydrogenase n=1 Tax=invertebrate metagenome TaxID=1711999 RepID=A0A484HBX2_9ZZZZ
MFEYSQLLERIAQVLGPDGLVTSTPSMDSYMHEERGLYHGRAVAVVRPASTSEAAAVVQLCAAAGVPLVPQGGNTSLVGGSVPWEHGSEILLSTKRLNRVRAVDSLNYTITVEAGCLLTDVQKAAATAGYLFPLSLGAAESCHIGGNLATNAGGLNVMRYGTARDLTLGLEVVLPDGQVWDGLRGLAKDNSGYALKHLFIGAEGTLGFITAAVLKLFPQPCDVQTALCALPGVEESLTLLSQARAASGDSVTAFELMPRLGLVFCLHHLPGIADPFAMAWPWYVLIELSTANRTAKLRTVLESLLEQSLVAGAIGDAVIADNLEKTASLWRIREGLPEAQRREGGSIKHDISVPVSRIPEFLTQATTAVTEYIPGIRVCAFGHVGDGNIHFNLSQPLTMDRKSFLNQWLQLNRVVHDIVIAMGGSIAAEHGIGRLKREEMIRCKNPVELELMRRIKKTLDPHYIMNPGKVIERT